MQQIQYDVRPGEFADAMKSTRSARMSFWLLLGLALIYQLVAYALVEFGGVLDTDRPALAVEKKSKPADKKPSAPAARKRARPATRKKPVKTKGTPAAKKPAASAKAPATKASTTKPVEAARGEPKLTKAEKWRLALQWSLPAAKFVAMVSALLLMLTILFAVGLSLVGRLGGMAGLISAFFWSLILFVMVVPWQQVLAKSTYACGALFNLGELLAGRARWGGEDATWQESTLYYVRFVGYPGVALLVWLVIHAKFSGASMRMYFPQAVPAAGVARPAAVAPAPEEPKPKPKPTPTTVPTPIPLAGGKISARGSLTERFFGAKTGKPKSDNKSDNKSDK